MPRDRIKNFRKQKGLSQAGLGKLVALTAGDISRIECGYRDLDDKEAEAIARAFGVPITELDENFRAEIPAPTPVAVVSPPPPASSPSPPPPVSVTPHVVPRGLAAAVAKPVDERPTPPPSHPATPAPTPEEVRSAPIGTDLNDPANFGVLPDFQILANRSDGVDIRERLKAELKRANTILHTSRIPAAVWRAWREFEKQASERLRKGPPMDPVAISTGAELVAESPTAEPSLGFKSFNATFVAVARQALPSDLVEKLNHEAEAAHQREPALGFMKHFRLQAEKVVEPKLIEIFTAEAAARVPSSPDRSRARRGRG